MATATEMIQQRDKDRQERIFQIRLEEFFRNYTPEDPREAAQFNTDLMMLVRQLYADAQEPLLKHITAML